MGEGGCMKDRRTVGESGSARDSEGESEGRCGEEE